MTMRNGAVVWISGWVLAAWGPLTVVQGATISMVPRSSTGPSMINGNEIVLTGTGQNVELEIRISGWDPDMNMDPLLNTFNITLDGSGYTSGTGTALAPLTTPNAAAGAFQVLNRCTVGQMPSPNGQRCDNPPTCPPGEFCIPNTDFVFTGFSPVVGVSTLTLDYEYGSAVNVPPPNPQGKADGGLTYYAGTLIVVVPSGAKGTYTIGFQSNPSITFLLNELAGQITPVTFAPAMISIACATAQDCDDVNACTSDVCNPDNTCSNPLNYNPATFCCNPVGGALTPLADGNACSQDVCDTGSGQVTHPPEMAGTACGSQASTECDAPDSCDGAGVCLANPRPGGTPCGDPSNTECDPADTCNGAGVCQNNRLPAGSACGSGTDNDCTDPDTCSAAGICQSNNAPNGTTCSDGLECNVGEACSNGACTGGMAVNCDDGLSCTTDACIEGMGPCVNTLNAGTCLIANVCFNDGQTNPVNSCQVCDPSSSTSIFTVLADGSLCDDGNPCTGTGAPGVGDDTCTGGVCSGLPDPECNDNCADAVDVFEGVNSGFSSAAAGPVDDAEASCQPDSNADIWFVYTASCTGPVFVSTTGSVFQPTNDSVLSIYDACGGNELACDDDSGVGLHAALVFNATNGVQYFIRVAGYLTNKGSVVVTIDTVSGCLIDNTCYAEDDRNPMNDCEVCLPDVSTTDWSTADEGTLCGDMVALDPDCDEPDACDGFGNCETNPKPDGTLCTDDGNECSFDFCGGGLCTHPPRASGTVCGDQGDTECDNPNTCDGIFPGTCLDNFELLGFACGDPASDQCNNPDICDGNGQCSVNFVPDGTLCNDVDVCTALDACDQGQCVGIPIPQAPMLDQLGPKVIDVTPQPPASPAPVALHVTSSLWTCIDKYVQADGSLGDTAVFQLPSAWGSPATPGLVRMIGSFIVPGSPYEVVEECGTFASPPGMVMTCLWGDVNCDGVANFVDINLIVTGFQGTFPVIPKPGLDIWPCDPDNIINFKDINACVRAFQGVTYFNSGCPVPCP